MAWAGLGMNQSQPWGGWSAYILAYHVTEDPKWCPVFAKYFPRIRCVTTYIPEASQPANPSLAMRIFCTYMKTNFPDTPILYGGSVAGVGLGYKSFTPEYYNGYVSYISDEAQWAQDNLMDDFQLGNEFEISLRYGTFNNGYHQGIDSLTRTSNVVTGTKSTGHGLTTGEYITVTTLGAGASADYRVNDPGVQVTVISPTVFTYPSVGANGTAVGSLTMNWSQEQTKIKIIEILNIVKNIFTRGKCVYSMSQGYEAIWAPYALPDGLTFGYNIYGANGTEFKNSAQLIFDAFGTRAIITEFNLHAGFASSRANQMAPGQIGFDLAYADEGGRRVKILQDIGYEQAYWYAGIGSGGSDFSVYKYTGTTQFLEGRFKAIINALRTHERREYVLYGV